MSGGLSNADFRKLLATPRPGAGGGGGGGGEGGGEKKKHKKPGKNFKPGGKLGEKEGAKEEGPQYRWGRALRGCSAGLCRRLRGAACLQPCRAAVAHRPAAWPPPLQGPRRGAPQGAVRRL